MNSISVEEKMSDSSQRPADGSQDLNSQDVNSEVQRRLDGQDERLVVVNQAIVDLKTNVESFQTNVQSSIGELTDLFKKQFKPMVAQTPQRQSFAALSSSDEGDSRSQDDDGLNDAVVNRLE